MALALMPRDQVRSSFDEIANTHKLPGLPMKQLLDCFENYWIRVSIYEMYRRLILELAIHAKVRGVRQTETDDYFLIFFCRLWQQNELLTSTQSFKHLLHY